MIKTTLRLTAFFILLCAAFLGCDNLTENEKKVYENSIRENREISYANQIYLDDIENYRKETGKMINSNSKKIAAYKLKIDTIADKCKYDYKRSVFKLELHNSYMEMKLDEYKPEGKEKWEIFKAEFASQLLELSKEVAGFSDSYKK